MNKKFILTVIFAFISIAVLLAQQDSIYSQFKIKTMEIKTGTNAIWFVIFAIQSKEIQFAGKSQNGFIDSNLLDVYAPGVTPPQRLNDIYQTTVSKEDLNAQCITLGLTDPNGQLQTVDE